MRLTSFLLSLALVSLLSACHEYKVPLCSKDYLFDPPGLSGTYKLILQDSKELDVLEQVITLQRADRGLYQVNNEGHLQVCKIGEKVFVESQGEQGNRSLYLLMSNEGSFDMVTASFDKKKLDEQGIPYWIEEREKYNPFKLQIGGEDKTKVLVVDNTDVGADKLMEAVVPLSLSFKFFKQSEEKVEK